MVMSIKTKDGETFNVSTGCNLVMSDVVRRSSVQRTLAHQVALSASRLRSDIRVGEVVSINGHVPEVGELMELWHFVEFMIDHYLRSDCNA